MKIEDQWKTKLFKLDAWAYVNICKPRLVTFKDKPLFSLVFQISFSI